MKVERNITDPAMPEELPEWTKFDGKTDATVDVKFTLPFPASLRSTDGTQQTPWMRNCELVVSIPVGMFAIFTEQCATSTKEQLGTKGGKRLLDAVAQEYYRGLILAKMTEKA